MSPGLDFGLLGPPGPHCGLLGWILASWTGFWLPGLDSGILGAPGLDSGFLGLPGLDSGLQS